MHICSIGFFSDRIKKRKYSGGTFRECAYKGEKLQLTNCLTFSVVILFIYLGFHFVEKLSEGDLIHVLLTEAPCNSSEQALCSPKWDCKNPLKNDIRNNIKTQFPLIRL